jgi:raffinose synthase
MTRSTLIAILCSFCLSLSAQQLSVSLRQGTLSIAGPEGVLISNLALHVRGVAPIPISGAESREDSGISDLSGALTDLGGSVGSDAAGAYRAERYQFMAEPEHAGDSVPFSAVLEIRHYGNPEAVVGIVEYQGPPPAAKDGLQLSAQLDQFGRGLAIHRLETWWTAPVFTSDYRLLPPNNLMLLWQRSPVRNYQVLVPLAGDGDQGELGDQGYRFRISMSSGVKLPDYTPHHVPIFAFASGRDPYQAARDAYTAGFAAGRFYGRLRWQKRYPIAYSSLGWCSWNTYYQNVTAAKVLNSVQSLEAKHVPIGFVLVDDGWLTVKHNRLAGYGADGGKFPGGMAALARTLREQYHIPHVGVWHAFEGYWDGVDRQSSVGETHHLFENTAGLFIPDPRNGAGASFYEDWYRLLHSDGIDFVKVDNQASLPQFVAGLLPSFTSGEGEQHNLEFAAREFFADPGEAGEEGIDLLNCMSMSLEDVYNWHYSNIARNSDDYFPDRLLDPEEHIYQNAYNSFWMSNFAWPDWDMFETSRNDAEFQSIARAISGGPVYTTDAAGSEHPEFLLPLVFSDGTLPRLDAPGEVTPDLLLRDPGLEPVALKVFGAITRGEEAKPYRAAIVAAFNVNKTADQVGGVIRPADLPPFMTASKIARTKNRESYAVYRRSLGSVTVLDAAHPELAFQLGHRGVDLFSVVPISGGAAALGLLNKYLGPAAIVSQSVNARTLSVRLREGGDAGFWLRCPPASVEINGHALAPSQWSYGAGLLRIPSSSFPAGTSEPAVRIALGR